MALVFEPQQWLGMLTAVAAGLLVLEAGALAVGLSRRYNLAMGVMLAVCGVAMGPVMAVGAIFFGVLASETSQLRGRHLLAAAVRGMLISLGASGLWWSTRAGSPVGPVLVIGACGAAWCLRSYRRTTARVSGGAKAGLLTLRLLALVLLVAWSLRPALEYRTRRPVRSVVLVGVDASASMQHKDMPADYRLPVTVAAGAQTRADAVAQALADQRATLGALADQADLEIFSFQSAPAPLAGAGDLDDGTGRLRPLPDPLPVPIADGPATAIGDATHAAFDPYIGAGRHVAGIVLITDGCNNTADVIDPAALARLMGSREVPVHTVVVGSDTAGAATRTLELKDLRVPREVNAFNRFTASAQMRARGLGGEVIRVICTFGAEEVARQDVVIDQADTTVDLAFTHVPVATGYQRLKLVARPARPTAEPPAGRGEVSELVQVVDRSTRILYVEGAFRYESKYIYRALQAGQRFNVVRHVIARPFDRGQAHPLPETLEDWLGYHAIVLGDVDASHFSPKQLEIIRELVGKYGKGLAMIGGARSFGAGNWEGTPVAEVLPVNVARSTGQIDRELSVRPTAEGLQHELLAIAPPEETPAQAWAKLPRLTGANRLVSPKLAATVLAETDKGEPLIVYQRYGAGRSLAIAFDTTWRWVLTPKDTAEYQRRFWRQVAIVLAQPKGNVWISTDQSSYDLRRLRAGKEVIHVEAGVEDAQGRPLENLPASVTLTGPDGATKPVQLVPRDNKRTGRLAPPTQPGEYQLTIAAMVEGKTLSAEHRFEVVHVDLEAENILADSALLAEMSRNSGGSHQPLRQLPGLLETLTVRTQPRMVEKPVHADLSARLGWPVLIAAIVLLCLEWMLRKRKGLV